MGVSSSLHKEEQQEENDSEVLFKIQPGEWKELMKNWKNLIEINIETFRNKQWMDHPKKAAFVNWRDASIANGATMLICAIWAGRFDLADLLLEHGADINIADNDGDTPLINASARQYDMVELLVENGADIQIANKKGETGLIRASQKGHSDIVKLLLEKDADLNIANNNGLTALMWASWNGHADIVKLLLEKGADINIANTYGWTALNLALGEGHTKIVGLLVEKGADITDNERETTFMKASEKGDNNTIKVLVEMGSDIKIADEDGNTALIWAVKKRHVKTVEVLLEIGADCKITNKQGRNAFTEAYFQDGTEIVDLLLDKAPMKDIVHDIVRFPQFANKFLQLFQENRDIVHWRDAEGRTVRQMACKECREVILFLSRFDVDDKPMYESPTCKIYRALDYGGQDEDLKQPRRVAMKFMEKVEHFLNEMRTRRNDDGSPRFSSKFVTPDLASYRADQDPEYAEACKTFGLPKYCLVMPLADRSLMEAMNNEYLSAPHKDLQRREILLTLSKIFAYLHEVGYVHGDIKAHNVVRHIVDGTLTWKAIDFDACTKIGDTVGLKVTTGSAPPEMFKTVKGEDAPKIVLRQPGTDGLDESDLVKADPSFDVWSFGILMYQLVTGGSFFHCDLQGNVVDAGLQEWANLTQHRINKKLESVNDVDARVLLSRILRIDPKERPTMSAVELDHYFHPSAGTPSEDGPPTFEYTSNDQEIPKSVTKLILGENLREIAKGACAGNDRLKEIDTSKAKSLEIVGEEAFEGCSSLEGFHCPSSVTTIQLDSFQGCAKLRGFTFSDAQAALLESIGDRAFYECRSLTTFKCPSHIKTIGKYSFHGCQKLQDVDLSDAHSLKSIEGGAFQKCTELGNVAIPENVTVIGEGFLDGCDALGTLVITGNNPILHMNVRLRLPETKKDLIPMVSIVKMYSSNPVKKSELLADSNKVASLLKEVKDGYIESIRGSDNPILKVAKREGWVQFLSAHADDANEDCIKKLIAFILDSKVKISVVRALADATDRLGRVAKMIAPEHIRRVFEERLFFLGRYDIAKGPPIHKSATCIVMKATDAKMSHYYKARFEECAERMNTVDEEKFTEILQKMKLISYDEMNIKALFHKADVDRSKTISKEEFVDFCISELGCDVALKFMWNHDQYRRELNGRHDLDARFVVGCIDNHDTSDPRMIKSLQDTMESLVNSGETFEKNDGISMEEFCGVIAMPFGDRNLATISQSERPGPHAVRKMMHEIGEAVRHLHGKGIVHGDLKMLNIVRINGRLSLIDLDASGRVDEDYLGSKFSSGVMPPEMIYKLKHPKELEAYNSYVAKGRSKGEMEKREARPTADKRQCFVVRSFWEESVLEEEVLFTNDKSTEGKNSTALNSVPILDGLPYSGDSDVLVRATKSFDVWSFGVLLYRLLTKEPLFHVNDADDITSGDEMKTLYNWSDDDLNSTIEDRVADRYAKRLLKKILNKSDPTKRLTMAEVLNDDYFNPSKVTDMSDVYEEVTTIKKISLDNRKLMKKEFAQVHNSLQRIQRFQAEANKLLQHVVNGQKVPRYFVILPTPDKNNNNSKKKKTFVRFLERVKDATNPDSFFDQPARLCFICPLSLQPVVDASGEAKFFDITVPKEWVKKYGPALLIGMKVAQVAMSVGRCFGLPLPSLSGAEDALAERSEVFSKLQELVVSGLGNEGEEGGSIADTLVSNLTDKLEESVSKDARISHKIQDRLQESYSGIEKLIPPKKKISDCGLIEAWYKDDDLWEYVHPEWIGVFEKFGSKCFDMSMEDLEMEKATLDSLSTATSRNVASNRLLSDAPATEMDMGVQNEISSSAVHEVDEEDKGEGSKLEKQVIIHGWLSKQSRKHSHIWHDRYFEIFGNGDVIYYPKGVRRGDRAYGVKLFKSVKWSKIVGEDNKLELRSPDRYSLGIVRRSAMDTLTLDQWLEKGNSWMEIPSSKCGNESKSSSKPRPKGAQTTAAGGINTLYAS